MAKIENNYKNGKHIKNIKEVSNTCSLPYLTDDCKFADGAKIFSPSLSLHCRWLYRHVSVVISFLTPSMRGSVT
jgi:hypothetical protein